MANVDPSCEESSVDLSYDDSDWTDEEMIAAAMLTFDEADSAGPIE